MIKSIKYLLVACWIFSFANVHAQNAQLAAGPVKNWQLMDLSADDVFGISLEKAYAELIKNKKSKTVIVAVIDGGLAIDQEDLKSMVWTNPKEIPGNGKDDDGNGYVDDVHGWNFLGSSKEDFEFDNEESVRQVRKYANRFVGVESAQVPNKDVPDYIRYRTAKKELDTKREKLTQEVYSISKLIEDVKPVLNKIGKENPTLDDFKKFSPANETEIRVQGFMIPVLEKFPDFNAYREKYVTAPLAEKQRKLAYDLNIAYDPRAKHAHEYAPSKGNLYGNANVAGPVPPDHGTHVAGIIAAVRNNNIGINGVTNTVLVMPVRAIPEGDERDQEDAAAIRYAADNGAKIINMSYGKDSSPDKEMVDEAVRYALAKGVLIVRATGNDGKDLDQHPVYPNRNYADKTGMADAWLEVGASGFTNDASLAAPFSNYGQKTVDVFAPGVEIYSTLPGNKYEAHTGTSMAAPLVSGLAALIWSHYPKLTAMQIKEIIMKSVVKADALKNKCITGGVVNAYNALKLAATY